ncbi:MAG: DUF3459 domain-containing protein [Lentisphaerae bacterium]|nr:DUF3459 domain-containing protein [Lentisphaerota bacterium]
MRYKPTYASVRDPLVDRARPVPAFLHSAVMYQIFLRPFTPEGTLAAAQALLPHVASLGVDIVYLCPVMLADDDPRQDFWSGRQRGSGLNNPRNPYRVKDFFAVDPEYGSAEDLRRFVDEVHRLGMRIIFDLVYFHCGPTAVFLDEHPDYVLRDEHGAMRIGEWRFPEMNLANPAVREYFYRNMAFFLRDYAVDGFRCDVADKLPVDFWEEGYRRCRAIKADCIMMCEGLRGDDQHEAFDLSYGFYTQWAIRDMLRGKSGARELQTAWDQEQLDYPRGFHWMRCFDNHDYAMDTTMHGGRYEASCGKDSCDAMLALIFTLNGMPMVYNGQEVADDAPHSIYANREYGRLFINWSRALTQAGKDRMDLLRKLTAFRHRLPALFDAPLRWLESSAPEQVFAFSRSLPEGNVFLAVNVAGETAETAWDSALQPREVIAASAGVEWPTTADGHRRLRLPPRGFVIGSCIGQ